MSITMQIIKDRIGKMIFNDDRLSRSELKNLYDEIPGEAYNRQPWTAAEPAQPTTNTNGNSRGLNEKERQFAQEFINYYDLHGTAIMETYGRNKPGDKTTAQCRRFMNELLDGRKLNPAQWGLFNSISDAYEKMLAHQDS